MRISLVLVPCLLVLPALAQEDMMAPAKELAKLDRMIGSFTGSGTVVPEPGMPEMAWTSKGTTKKILGGHFLHNVMEIDMGEAMPTTMQMQGVLGFDREKGEFIGAGVSNMGSGGVHSMHWVDADTIVTHDSLIEDGNLILQRETMRLRDDGYDIKIERAIGAGEFFVHVEGKIKRDDKSAGDVKIADASFMNLPAAPEMTELLRCAGSWDVKGTMIPMPGMPEVPISGRDEMQALWGGQVLVSKVKGDPMPPDDFVYEMISFTTWNATKQQYEQVYCDNAGVIGHGVGRWDGKNAIVITADNMLMGKPTVGRTILHLDDAGHITKVTSELLHGTMGPSRVFQGTYTPAKK